MDEYARSWGHVPTANWILVVHADNSSELHTFEDATEMWCCQQKHIIRNLIDTEVAQLAALEAKGCS